MADAVRKKKLMRLYQKTINKYVRLAKFIYDDEKNCVVRFRFTS